MPSILRQIADKVVTLPPWLDTLIYDELDGMYCRENSDMTVIDWTRDKILNYLGTYFPRSYAESYCIFKQYLNENEVFLQKDSLKMLDFGCGTGGEIIGFATALSKCRPNIKTLKIKAIDGNRFALNRFEDIRDEFNKRYSLQIEGNPSAIKIDDFYDLGIVDEILDYDYDVVVSFKAVCEFVTKQQFEEKNPYEHLTKFMLPRIADDGIMLLVDITTKNNTTQEWLPVLMDNGLKKAGASDIERNVSYNECFVVKHSRQPHGDTSKIAWRLILK